MASSTGIFRIEKPASEKEMILQISSVGYEATEILVTKETDGTKDLLVRLNLHVMGEVVVVDYPTVKGRITVGGVTSKTEEKTFPEKVKKTPSVSLTITSSSGEQPPLKLYPNPVQRNNVFNLEWKNDRDEMIKSAAAVVSLNGTMIFQQSQKISKGFNRLSFNVDARWPAGVYILQLINEKGGITGQEKLVVQ